MLNRTSSLSSQQALTGFDRPTALAPSGQPLLLDWFALVFWVCCAALMAAMNLVDLATVFRRL